MSGRSEPEFEKPVFECVGLAGGSIVGGCVIGGRNIKIRGPIAQHTRVVGVLGGHHTNAQIIGLDGATIGGDSDDDDVNLKDPGTYFGGKDTGVLLIAGKAKEKDGPVFINDLDDITEKLVEMGIRDGNIFRVTHQDRGKQVRNIGRAVEDLTDLGIKKFILFYAGHCNANREFLVADQEKGDYWYPHQELKKCLQELPATKMLLILDTCYSGSLDMGTRGGDEEGGEDGGRAGEDDEMEEEDAGTRAISEFSGGALPFSPPVMPCLWDIFEGISKSDDGSRGGDDTQAIQWCSSSPDQRSHNHGGGRNGVFTNAIKEYMDGLQIGHSASVLDMHKHVKNKISLRQTPLLYPDRATMQSSGYIKTFPKFRKTMFYKN